MSDLAELERLISVRIIREDAEAIYSLLTTEKDSIFSMEIIPYYALFIQSCQEYMGENFCPESIAKDFKDIRNHIKIYSDSFGKSKKRVSSVDSEQDRDFREQLRFDFLKKKNIHLNLGSYWTEDYHIVGNTQQLADFLSVKSMFDPNIKDKYFQMGHQINSFVSSVRKGFAESLNYPQIERAITSTTVKYYYDINTNKRNKLFNDNITKELNLFFMHLLCNMNFVKYILKPLFVDGNTWVFRVEYIVSYYTLRALERLKNYSENNTDTNVDTKDIANILRCGENLFQSKLRNCLMHYDLENRGVITFENSDKPFYGIIENCFKGMSYQEYLSSLNNLSNIIIEYLEQRFDFSNVKLKKLRK